MDIATVIGIVLGTVAVFGSIMAGGPLSAFIDVGSIFIVVGGTIASTLISFSLKQVTAVIGVVKKTFLYPLAPPGDTIKQLVHFADMARRGCLLGGNTPVDATWRHLDVSRLDGSFTLSRLLLPFVCLAGPGGRHAVSNATRRRGSRCLGRT